MTRFEFRLEKLLKLREATRHARRAELAEAYEAERLLRERSEALAREHRQQRLLMAKVAAGGSVDVDALAAAHRYAAQLQLQIQQLEKQQETIAQEVLRRRQRLAEAEADVRALEKLKERRAHEHRIEQQRAEDKELDEAALRRHAVAPTRETN